MFFILGVLFGLGVFWGAVSLVESQIAFWEDEMNPYSPNHIQPSNLDIDFVEENGSVVVEDVDYVHSVSGSSMRPTIFTGNTILYREFNHDFDTVEEGDIVRFRYGDGAVVHRVAGNYVRTSGKVVTLGDNNEGTEHVPVENITHVAVGTLYTE